MVLAVSILQETYNPESYWAPYFATIPKHYGHLPSEWIQSDLDYLQHTGLLEIIQKRRTLLHDSYQILCSFFENFSYFFSEYDYRMAYYTVQARSFGVIVKDAMWEVIVPVIDMIDHLSNDKPNFFVRFSLEQPQHVELVSFGAKKGDRVTIAYGYIHTKHTLVLSIQYFYVVWSYHLFATAHYYICYDFLLSVCVCSFLFDFILFIAKNQMKIYF